jgi:hypothetical protein
MTRAQRRRTSVFSGAFSCLASSRLRSQLRRVVPDAAPPVVGRFATAGKAISGEIRPKYPALILLHEQQNNSCVITLLQIIGLKVAPNHTLAKKVGARGGWRTSRAKRLDGPLRSLVAQGAPVCGGPGVFAGATATTSAKRNCESILDRAQSASGFGRIWNFTSLLVVPLPPSIWKGARVEIGV